MSRFVSEGRMETTLLTLQAGSRSEIALRPALAAVMASCCLPEFPAKTALLVAVVSGLVKRIRDSGVTLSSM